jgi:autotransporter family porin
MLGTGHADSSAQSQLTGYSARGRVRGAALGVYATWLQDGDGLQGAYLDSSLQRGRFHNRVQGIGLQREQYASRNVHASLEGGYTLAAWQGAAASVHLQPGMQVQHVRHRAGRHVESNGTEVTHADGSATQARVGMRVFALHEDRGRVLQPYVAVNWLRSHGAQSLDLNGVRQRGNVPRSRYDLQAGIDLGLQGRWGMWAGVGLQHGGHGYRDLALQMGLRHAW